MKMMKVPYKPKLLKKLNLPYLKKKTPQVLVKLVKKLVMMIVQYDDEHKYNLFF